MTATDPSTALGRIAIELSQLGKRFAVVGGLAVSIRGEVRFTRHVDLAVDVRDDAETEQLARDLGGRGYRIVALVEHDEARRLATVRLRSPSEVTVDLLTASSGIEAEIVARSSVVLFEGLASLPVAQAEELVAMKVLAMDDRRLQDRIDATTLLENNPSLDLEQVRSDLRLIEQRGFHRHQDLTAKLRQVLDAVERG